MYFKTTHRRRKMKKLVLLLLVTFTALSLEAAKPKKIIVYTKEGCGRCKYVEGYMKENKIKHKELSVANKENQMEMWALLKKDGLKGSVTMPVVLIGKKLYYNMKDLKSFVAKLK